jgi:type I restriction enzyme, S subunit
MEVSIKRLGELAETITKGTTPTSLGMNFAEGGIAFLRVQNIEHGKVFFEKETLHIDEKTHRILKRSQIRARDILVTIAGSIGRAAIVPDNAPDLNCNQAVAIVRIQDKVFHPYLRLWLESEDAQTQMRGATVTGTISNLSLTQLGNLQVPLPPIAQQKRIAAILDQAEALRSHRREAIGLLDELGRSVFLEMFGDVEENDWVMATIENILSPVNGAIRTGPFGSQLLHSEFTTEGIAVLGIDNAVSNEFRWSERRFISESKYHELKRYTVKPNDVIITIMGTCGRCAVVPNDIPLSINTKHLCCITLDQNKCLPKFLHAYFLMHPIARQYLEQTMKGAIMAGLNMGIIRQMPIPLVPLPLQQQFAQRIAAIEALKATQREALSQLDALFASLQHRAFRGEL